MKDKYKQKPIAIIGIGGIFPEALNIKAYWNNILNKKDCIKEINDQWEGFWKAEDHYSPDPSAPDKTYAKKAGFLPEIAFDPMAFAIPPINIEAISQAHLFALLVAKQAFDDSGILNYQNREKIGVVIGGGETGNTAFFLGTRTEYTQWKKVLKNFGLPEEMASLITEKLKNLYPDWQENSLPGFLSNVTAGRICNFFDLSGSNYSLNAACATSLAAVRVAMSELNERSCDAVITGGVGTDNSIVPFMAFTKTPVISKSGCSRPYDAKADGMMLGDGIGFVILKRLEDAERDGDKIYAVIKGIGSSSDGKTGSIYAPDIRGQVKAMMRAYENADCSPATVGLIEGHGTATVVGDFAEFQSMSEVFGTSDIAKHSIALGSVKSQIGHGRVSAGAASLTKTVMALYHKILPPTIHVEKPNPRFDMENSPFYLNTEPRPWFRPKDDTPRRAAVSAFGFGGTNFHLILEEYRQKGETAYRISDVPEMVFIHGPSHGALRENCAGLLEQFESEDGASHYANYLHRIQHLHIPEKSPRVGFAAKSFAQAIRLLQTAIEQLNMRKERAWAHPKGIFYRSEDADIQGRVVALFPGQGSQYLNMCSQIACNYPVMRHAIEHVDHALQKRNFHGISDIIYPPPCFDEDTEHQQRKELVNTEYAQPAIGAVSAGLYKILANAGFKPDFAVGHSFGELTALWAAGVMDDDDFTELEIERGRAMAQCRHAGGDPGAMLAVAETHAAVSQIISRFEDVGIANFNSPGQVVIAGGTESVRTIYDELKAAGKKAKLLPVSAAFHTRFVKSAQDAFAHALNGMDFKPAKIPIFANQTGKKYADSPDEMKAMLLSQIVSPVLFQQAIESVYEEGGYLFVEIGPGNILTNLTKEILRGKDHIAIALNSGNQHEDEFEFRQAIVRLAVSGLQLENIDPYRSWDHQNHLKEQSKTRLSVTINGGHYLAPETIRRRDESLYGKNAVSFQDVLENTILSKGEHNMSEERRNSSSESARLTEQTEGMGVLDTIHLHYQKNQEKYLDLLAQVFRYQNTLMEKFHDSPNLNLLLENLQKTLTLLEANQPYYHTVHGEYIRANSTAPGQLPEESHIDLRSKSADTFGKAMPAPSKRPDPDEIIRRMLQLLSEHTGEPSDQIDMDADLELDMELDMAAYVEILDTLHREFALSRENRDEFETLRTMNEVYEYVKKRWGGISDKEQGEGDFMIKPESAPVSEPETKPPLMGITLSSGHITSSPPARSFREDAIIESDEKTPLPAPSDVAFNVDDVIAQILEIFSEKTGYPADMIEMDMDISKDLGVDSIKFIEILGALQQKYPDAEMGEGGELPTLRTLGDIAEYVRHIAQTGSIPREKKTLYTA